MRNESPLIGAAPLWKINPSYSKPDTALCVCPKYTCRKPLCVPWSMSFR